MEYSKTIFENGKTFIIPQTEIQMMIERLGLASDTPESAVRAAWEKHQRNFEAELLAENERFEAAQRVQSFDTEAFERQLSNASDVNSLKSALLQISRVISDIQKSKGKKP